MLFSNNFLTFRLHLVFNSCRANFSRGVLETAKVSSSLLLQVLFYQMCLEVMHHIIIHSVVSNSNIKWSFGGNKVHQILSVSNTFFFLCFSNQKIQSPIQSKKPINFVPPLSPLTLAVSWGPGFSTQIISFSHLRIPFFFSAFSLLFVVLSLSSLSLYKISFL